MGKEKKKDHRGGKEKGEMSKRKQASPRCSCLPSRWEEDSEPLVLRQHPIDFSLESVCKENNQPKRNTQENPYCISKYHGEITKLRALKNECVGFCFPSLFFTYVAHAVFENLGN